MALKPGTVVRLLAILVSVKAEHEENGCRENTGMGIFLETFTPVLVFSLP
ncbi:hypothetical protein SATMO3_36570 [Sporomusa aerivorans]